MRWRSRELFITPFGRRHSSGGCGTDHLFKRSLHHLDRSVVVAVVAVRMVETPLDDIIDMVAVGNRLVPTAGTMDVMIGVGEMVHGSTSIGIVGGNPERMFLNGSVFILMMKVSIVDKIDVIPVLYLSVAAAWVVDVIVRFVAFRWFIHGEPVYSNNPLIASKNAETPIKIALPSCGGAPQGFCSMNTRSWFANRPQCEIGIADSTRILIIGAGMDGGCR
jgi:hypothetical protein